MIIFENVSCTIGRTTILDDISLEINDKGITGIIGQNGAGKSTLLSLITALRKHSSGNLTVFDQRMPSRGKGLRQRIGVVLQETALYEELTTVENLRFSASLYNVENAKARVAETLDLLGLSERADHIVSTLSGGLRRRIAIARALLHDPELLIIDEPTLGVDAEARHAIWMHLRLLKSYGRTVVIATNYLDEAQALCDTVAVLRKGKLLAVESPEALISRIGYCLDIECEEETANKIVEMLLNDHSILRIDRTPGGLSLFLKSNSIPKEIACSIIDKTPIEGFRVRPPDLAEVFKSFESFEKKS